MKRTINILFASMVILTVSAAPISRQQARQQAAQFVLKQGAQLGSEPTTVSGRRVQADDQPLYVFNTADNRGFVVVSGDDRTDAILGYTLQGNFDDATVPENLRHWFDQMTAEIEALGNEPAAARAESKPRQVAIHSAVGPLLATTWNQGNWGNSENTDGIYNIRLPQIGSAYPCTGCVATAGAQIMYYYKWPETTLEVPGYNSQLSATSNSLPAKEFEWDKMKTSYTSADAYSEAAYAVADLMLYAGWAAHMSYDIDGSSSSQVTLADNMVKYFGYDPYWQHVSRDNYLVADWDELIYNELACGRPVIYDGSSDRGGHAFICDGYDGNGFYHFNWGWGGGSNGYFKLQATNPDGAYGFPGYVFGNTAIIGLQPYTGVTPDDPNADDEWEEDTIEGMVAEAGNVALEGTITSMNMGNPNEQVCQFNFGIGELDDNETINVLKDTGLYDELSQGWYYTGITYDFSTMNLPEGTHRLVPVSKLNGEEEWKRCHPAELWFEVNVEGDNITAIQHPIVDLQVNECKMVSGGVPDKSQSVLVNITNNGDNLEQTLYLYVDGEWKSRKNFKIASGNTKEFTLSTGVLSEGIHTVTLHKGYNGDVLTETTVDIKIDLAATAFSVNSEGKFAGTPIPVDVTVESHAGDYTTPLYFFASQSDTKGSPAYIAGTAIPGGGSDDVRFYFTPATGGTWNLWVTTDESGYNVIGTGSAVIVDAPLGTVTLELVNGKAINKPNGVVDYEMTVKNTGEVTFYRNFTSHLWVPKEENQYGWSSANDAFTEDIVIEPGEEVIVTLTFTNLVEGGSYCIDPRYPESYNSNTLVAFNEHWWNIEFTYTAPTDIEPDPTPDPIPGNLDGDEGLDADDVSILVNSLLDKQPLPEGVNADVNDDGIVDIVDVVTLIKLIVNPKSE